jgi:3-hydroxyisobutyrate dehydrogenase
MNTTQDSKRTLPRVTVLGAGTMGSAMSHRLLSCGFHVGVWNLHPAALRALAESGAETFSDPREAVRHAEVVLTLLPTADVVREVMTGAGVLDAMSTGRVWVQMGTIGVQETGKLSEEVRSRYPGVLFVDAPVSGSRAPAETGQLLILASGPDDAKAIVDPVFGALGRSTLWLGPAGAGSQMKLVLNTWLAFQTEGAAESAAIAERFSLRTEDLLAALRGNPIASDYALAKLGRMIDGDYRADFSLDWALKDLDLVTAEVPGAAPVAGAIAERWRELVRTGWSGSDVSAARNGLDLPHGSGPA